MKRKFSTLKFSYNRYYCILLYLLNLSFLYTQEYTISGKSQNESGKKLATRIVLYDNDKRFIEVYSTSNNGKFKFKKIVNGSYLLNLYGDNGYSAMEKVSVEGNNVANLEIQLTKFEDQPQLSVKSTGEGVEIKWRQLSNILEYVIYRDNNEIDRVTNTKYLDKVIPGQTYAYNILPIKNDQSNGTRSITEYGKRLMPFPLNIVAKANKNMVTLSWDNVKDAIGYKIYRDDELVNSAPENSYSDYKLKFETEYNYTISSLDHQNEEGDQSTNIFVTTHPEIKQPKGLKAEGGENQVILTWKASDNSVKYYIYQNGVLVDSTNNLTGSVTTEAGSENCFSVSGVDQYGSIGPRSAAACDKSVFSAPDTVITSNDKRNNNTISWNLVEGASTYNLYRDNKLLINTSKLEFIDKLLEWDTEYTYHLTSLTDEGAEGPKSLDYKQSTPPIYTIKGVLIDENGEKDNVDQAKVFLYDSLGTKLLEEYVVSRNGKFSFDKEIIAGNYTIMAYGNGSGNGGGRVNIINQNIEDLKIDLSTEGLRSTIRVERGVGELTIHWTDIPQAKSYNIYKNDRLIQSVSGDTSYLDIVAPGIEMTYKVMSVDIYDLEGPESNEVTEKSSFGPPEMTITILAGGYTTEGSGRNINLEWLPVAGVENYALYRDGNLLIKQSENKFEERELKWNTTYVYEINSIDKEGIEGVNAEYTIKTHPEVFAPDIQIKSEINGISLSWAPLETIKSYKIFRNGGNIADIIVPEFIDAVTPGIEYCYTVALEDTHKTVGPKAEIKCGKGYFAPPTNFNAKVMRNQVNLSWESVAGASGYHLYRNNELILDTEDLDSFKDEGLEYDVDYLYEICSYDKDKYEGPKVEFKIKSHEKVLETSFSAEVDLEKVSLIWEKSNLKVDHSYRIYRDDEILDETIDTSFQDFVPAGKYYCYIIRVVDKYGTESPPSNKECKKILVNYPKLLSVTGDVKRVLFGWKYMIGAVQYNIYSVNKETDSLTLISKTKGNFFQHQDLDFDTEYCYQVSCVDSDGDEGPKSPTMCGWVLPPPHLTLIERRFVESSGNGQLDGRENAWLMYKIVNDGKSPARELKPWLKPLGETMTSSLKIDSVSMIPLLDIGDTATIQFSLYAKLKVETQRRNFKFFVEEFTGEDLEPDTISFKTLEVVPPNLVVTDFSVTNDWGQNYIPKNETAMVYIRVQNLSTGKSDTASVKFRRDESFISEDADELHQLKFINAGEYIDFKFEIMSREDNFTLTLELYDYFETRKTIPLHLETMKQYKSPKDMIIYNTPYPEDVVVSEEIYISELATNIPKVSAENEILGIVIGNHNFNDPKIKSQPSTKEDVKIVRRYFKNLFNLKDYSIIPSQYWLFEDGINSDEFSKIFDPDFGYIKKKIESLSEYSDKKSIDLILYYSGEGTTYNNEKVLIPYDADSNKRHTFYPISKIYYNLKKLQKMKQIGEITLFMDVDFNNSSFEQNIVKIVKEDENSKKKKKKKKKKKGGADESIVILPKEIEPPSSITAFYSSDINQLSYDSKESVNSIFTYYLLQGLKGEADNGDKEITISELHNYIQKKVKDKTSELYIDLPQVPILYSSNPERVLYRLP